MADSVLSGESILMPVHGYRSYNRGEWDPKCGGKRIFPGDLSGLSPTEAFVNRIINRGGKVRALDAGAGTGVSMARLSALNAGLCSNEVHLLCVNLEKPSTARIVKQAFDFGMIGDLEDEIFERTIRREEIALWREAVRGVGFVDGIDMRKPLHFGQFNVVIDHHGPLTQCGTAEVLPVIKGLLLPGEYLITDTRLDTSSGFVFQEWVGENIVYRYGN